MAKAAAKAAKESLTARTIAVKEIGAYEVATMSQTAEREEKFALLTAGLYSLRRGVKGGAIDSIGEVPPSFDDLLKLLPPLEARPSVVEVIGLIVDAVKLYHKGVLGAVKEKTLDALSQALDKALTAYPALFDLPPPKPQAAGAGGTGAGGDHTEGAGAGTTGKRLVPEGKSSVASAIQLQKSLAPMAALMGIIRAVVPAADPRTDERQAIERIRAARCLDRMDLSGQRFPMAELPPFSDLKRSGVATGLATWAAPGLVDSYMADLEAGIRAAKSSGAVEIMGLPDDSMQSSILFRSLMGLTDAPHVAHHLLPSDHPFVNKFRSHSSFNSIVVERLPEIVSAANDAIKRAGEQWSNYKVRLDDPLLTLMLENLPGAATALMTHTDGNGVSYAGSWSAAFYAVATVAWVTESVPLTLDSQRYIRCLGLPTGPMGDLHTRGASAAAVGAAAGAGVSAASPPSLTASALRLTPPSPRPTPAVTFGLRYDPDCLPYGLTLADDAQLAAGICSGCGHSGHQATTCRMAAVFNWPVVDQSGGNTGAQLRATNGEGRVCAFKTQARVALLWELLNSAKASGRSK